jgi:CTP-dependent riboflavin kinase
MTDQIEPQEKLISSESKAFRELEDVKHLRSLPDKNTVRLHGIVARGVIRGHDLIERFSDRLDGLLGFRPYLGTLNVKLEKPINIEDFETKRVEHILLDGSLWIDARLAPIKFTFKDKTIDAWAIEDERGLHEADVLEVIHKERLMEMFGLKMGDEVIIELKKTHRTLKSKLKEVFRPLWPKAARIVR